jgi:tetratricopeptide (TPR) repeat protein
MGLLNRIRGKLDPRFATNQIVLGATRAREGRFADALQCYEAAIDAEPDNALAHFNRALALQDLYNQAAAALDDDDRVKRLLDIRESLRAAVEKDPALVLAYRHLGHVCKRLAAYEEAQWAFEEGLVLGEGLDDAVFPHAGEMKKLLEEVREAAERERAENALVALALDEEAEKEAMQEALDKLVELFGRALPDASDSPPSPETPESGVPSARVFWARGVVHRRLDHLDDARRAFEDCVALEPRHLAAHRELAQICMKNDEKEGALRHSVVAYQEDPTDPALVCNVGVCHLALGNGAEAREFIELAAGLDPNGPIILRALEALAQAESGAAGGSGDASDASGSTEPGASG